MTIEPARLEDAAALLALHRAVLAEGHWFITAPGEFALGIDQQVRRIREFERQPNSIFLVAREAGRAVGFVTCQGGIAERMRHAGKLEMMVDRERRGQGIGRALMSHLIAWARQNPQLIKLGLSVFADNASGLTLYQSLGFREEGRRTREYRMADGSYRDDVLMYLFVD